MCFHSEVEMVGVVLYLACIYKKRVHICHVSRRDEIEMIRDAKEAGIDVTCEVTPTFVLWVMTHYYHLNYKQ